MIETGSLVQEHGELLRANDLFAGLDGVALAKLAARLEVVRLGEGDELVQTGEPGDALYVISRGRFGVFVDGPSGDCHVRSCGPGELIGEMALVTGGVRSATVRAESEAEVLRMTDREFHGLVQQNPSVALAVAGTLSHRLRNVDSPADRAQSSTARPIAAGRLDSVKVRFSLRQAIGLVLAALAVGAGWLMPPPPGFSTEAWHAAATLLAVVPMLACGALPDGVIALSLVGLWVLGGVATPAIALGGFASSTWVLTIAVFIIGAVITSSGLLFRVALWTVEHARGGFKTEAGVLFVTGLISSAAIPNPSGRMLLIAPAVTEMSEAFGYAPGSRAAAGLAMAALLGFGQTVAPFLTSSTTTLLTFTLLPESSRAGLDWGTWALRAAPTYAVLLLGMLAFITWRYAPKHHTERRKDALPVQQAILGPITRHERIVGVVSLALLVGFATQPLHHVEPAWVAVGALGILAAAGLVTPDVLRSVNWNYALLFGTLASVVEVFATSGLNHSLATLITSGLGGLIGSPLAFVGFVALIALVSSFVLRFAALAPLLTVALAPVAVSLGIDPWVVAITALVATSGFFLPYQNTTYLAIHQELDGKLFTHRQARPVALVYGGLVLVALCASVPVWHLMGLL